MFPKACASVLVVAAGILLSPRANAESVWVQVRESALRSRPAYYSPATTILRYGEELDQLGVDGGWVRVRARGGEGYVPLASISRNQIVLSVKEISKIKADSADIVLAGKGFSREVEANYRKENLLARYDRVDQVERDGRVSLSEVDSFRKSGGLK